VGLRCWGQTFLAWLRTVAMVRKGKELSPVLLVRGDVTCGLPAQIADG